MKININPTTLKKGLLLTGISLMCTSVSGCSKEKLQVNNSINYTELTNDIIMLSSGDTINVLNTYNSALKSTKLNINDLEWLSNCWNGVISLKRDNGTYAQVSYDSYSIYTHYDNTQDLIIDNCTSILPHIDQLTGKKVDSLTGHPIPLGSFICENNIQPKGYTFPKTRAWSDSDKESIIKKYGEEVWEATTNFGIPIKMYNIKDFYTKREKNYVKCLF